MLNASDSISQRSIIIIIFFLNSGTIVIEMFFWVLVCLVEKIFVLHWFFIL